MGKYDEGKFAVPPSLSLGDAMNFAHGVGIAEATEKLSQEIAQIRKEKEHLGDLLEQSWRAGAESIREVEHLKAENKWLKDELSQRVPELTSLSERYDELKEKYDELEDRYEFSWNNSVERGERY